MAPPARADRMRRRRGVRAWLGMALLLFAGIAWAQVAVPKLTDYVTDLTGTLDATQKQALETRLRTLDQATGTQIAILMVPTLGDQPLEDYSLKVAEGNVIGRKKVDDGILVLVVKDDRKARIEVGYGLEGAVPDITAGRIIREYMGPRFRDGDYAGGLNDAVDVLEKAVRGEQLPAPASQQGEQGGGDWLFALVAAFIAASVARGFFGKAPSGVRGLVTGAVAGGVAWWMSSLLGLLGVAAVFGFLYGLLKVPAGHFARGGGWGGFGGGGGWSGGGGFGGGGGGGFSGGGGSFGGGGASGSW